MVERKGVAERPDALLVVGRTHPRAMVPATASHSQKVISTLPLMDEEILKSLGTRCYEPDRVGAEGWPARSTSSSASRPAEPLSRAEPSGHDAAHLSAQRLLHVIEEGLKGASGLRPQASGLRLQAGNVRRVCSRSATRSPGSSMPTDRRMTPSVMPALSRAAGVIAA